MKILASLMLALSVLVAAAPAEARAGNRTHIAHHPRVNQVNRRFKRQAGRVHRNLAHSNMTHGQAHAMHQERHQLKSEEHAMRKADNGHLTHADQHQLNQQMNNRSQQIINDRKSSN